MPRFPFENQTSIDQMTKYDELDPTKDSKRHCIDCEVVLLVKFSIDLCLTMMNEDEFLDRDVSNRKPYERRQLN